MGNVDHGVAEAAVELLQLAAQLPLHLRIDDRQRLVEEDRVDVGAHEAAAQGDFLFLVGGQAASAAIGAIFEADHLEDLGHPPIDLVRRKAPVAQREGEVLRHGHGVVDDRKLEYLRDVALFRRPIGHVLAVKEDIAFAGCDEA